MMMVDDDETQATREWRTMGEDLARMVAFPEGVKRRERK
jgi:hypothetical protein